MLDSFLVKLYLTATVYSAELLLPLIPKSHEFEISQEAK